MLHDTGGPLVWGLFLFLIVGAVAFSEIFPLALMKFCRKPLRRGIHGPGWGVLVALERGIVLVCVLILKLMRCLLGVVTGVVRLPRVLGRIVGQGTARYNSNVQEVRQRRIQRPNRSAVRIVNATVVPTSSVIRIELVLNPY